MSTSKKILVVDDSSTNRFLLKAILNTVGYEVDECADGLECVAYCKRTLPQMILLDVMMPGMDGLEATRELRKQFDRDVLPIILVTTRSEGKDIAEGLEAGANDYVTKPIDRSILLARLESQLSLSRSRAKIEEQRHEIESALRVQRAMGDVMPEALLLHDYDGVIVYSNRQLLVANDDKTAATIKELAESIYSGRLKSVLERRLMEVAHSPQIIFEQELELPSGAIRNIRLVSKPVLLDAGAELRLWVFRDVTHTRELERRISQQMRLDTVALFSSGVAHNFNNILGGILGASELLTRLTAGNEKSQRCVGVIKRGVESGMKLTKKMAGLEHFDLDSHAKSGSDVKEALDRAVLASQFAIRDDLQHEVTVDAHLPKVRVHMNNLMEIFSNLINNAVDAISGPGRIDVKGAVSADKKFVEVIVRDNGSGMSPEIKKRLFEPFFSTKNMDQVNGISIEGNGLGLFKVYSLLKAFQGDIAIESQPGKGTEVKVLLPVLEG